MQFYPRSEVMFFSVISVLFTFIIHEVRPWKMMPQMERMKVFHLFFWIPLPVLEFPSNVFAIVAFLTCVSHNIIWHREMLFGTCLLTHRPRRQSPLTLSEERPFQLWGFFVCFQAYVLGILLSQGLK